MVQSWSRIASVDVYGKSFTLCRNQMVSAVQISGMTNVLVLAVFPCQLGARGGMRVCAEDLWHTSAEIGSSEVELVTEFLSTPIGPIPYYV